MWGKCRVLLCSLMQCYANLSDILDCKYRLGKFFQVFYHPLGEMSLKEIPKCSPVVLQVITLEVIQQPTFLNIS